ncbi:DUF368 domain-containing protein [Ancrocorticia populi]|uniref:DUF368 domain-containing protein n=1 Tax=Ancrocorticia populi TaxID=2175228 RepID=A0A2V1K7F6_9ACTO|nr:DUF368 domain-containing protein [Ancrocorticia populi]PWF26117.1 DUF368 domain-containing protein [Ancrocorticia populi]
MTETYRRTSIPGNLVRGAMMGAVETVPGTSGGTVALVVGIYYQIIDSAGSVISALRRLITGPDRKEGFKQELSKVYWSVVIPVLIGMVAALFTVAGPMANLMEAHPVQMRSIFFGMVLASVSVPVRMMLRGLEIQRRNAAALGRGTSDFRVKPHHIVFGIVAAITAFILVSLPPANAEANIWIVVPAAAIAVSALVLPGLSGSFLLLTFGLYESTMRAVSELDLGYLAPFLLGILIGIILVVKSLQWLLNNHHTTTLAVLTGVMIGGLRSLWPWQDAARNLSAPGSDLWGCIGLAAIGFAAVMVLVILDAKLAARDEASV